LFWPAIKSKATESTVGQCDWHRWLISILDRFIGCTGYGGLVEADAEATLPRSPEFRRYRGPVLPFQIGDRRGADSEHGREQICI
jgi:hypothetical protein